MLVTIITINIAIKENPKLTKPDKILENGNRYLGIYTFLINAEFDIIEFNALVVDSELKENNKDPDK